MRSVGRFQGPKVHMIIGPKDQTIIGTYAEDHLKSLLLIFGCQKAPQNGFQSRHFMIPKRCPKNGMLSDPKCPPNLVFCVPCGPWKSCEDVQLSTNTHVAFFLTRSPPDTKNNQKQRQQGTHKSTNMSQHPSSKLAVFLPPILMPF